MPSVVHLSHKRGQAPPPLEVGTAVELTRTGDQIAQLMFETLATEEHPAHVSPAEWAKAAKIITRSDEATTAGNILDRITRGTVRQRHTRAKKAACLILHTVAGLTMEQLGAVFNHPKGHISRLVREAASEYRDALTTDNSPGDAPLSEQPDELLSQLSLNRKLNFRDRERLKRRARRIAEKLLTLTEPERAYIVPLLRRVLGTV